MPKKRSKSKSTDSDLPDLETRKIYLQSIGMPSPYRGGSTTTSSTDDSSSSCTTTETGDSSNNAESKEPAAAGTSTSYFQSISESGKTCDNEEVSTSICKEGDETDNTERLKPTDATGTSTSYFPSISESGKTCDNEEESASICQEGEATDNTERLKPTDTTSILDCQVISKDENIGRQKETEPLSLDSEPTSKAIKSEDSISEEISSSVVEVSGLLLESVNHAIKDEAVCERESFAAETQQEKSTETFSGNTLESGSKTAVLASVSSDVSLLDPCNTQTAGTMFPQSTEDRAFESVPYALKETRDHKNIKHVTESPELIKDSLTSPVKKVVPHGKSNDKSPKSERTQFKRQKKELKYIDPDANKDQAAPVKSDPCSFSENHPKHEVAGESTEPRPKRASSALLQGKDNIGSQIKLATMGSEKGRERTGVPFKHKSESSPGEQETKRAKTSFTEVRPKVSPRKLIRASSKRREKCEPTSKTMNLPATQRIDVPQPESSSEAKEESPEMGKNYTLDVPHRRMSRARTLSRAKPERDEIVTRSKSSLEVSPRKRKSSESTSCFSEKVNEQIPPKRAQRSRSLVVSPTPGTSSGVNRTSPRVHRQNISLNRKRSKSWTATCTSSKGLKTETMSVKEFLLFRGMTEPPTIPTPRVSWTQASTSIDESSHAGPSREDRNENTAEEYSKENPIEYESGSSISDVEIHDLSQATTGIESNCRNEPEEKESTCKKELDFAEFKETLGADKIKDLDLSLDVFDKALGIDRSIDHSAPEQRQPIKMITTEEFLETMDHGDGKNPRRVPPADTKTGVSESPPQSVLSEGHYEGVSTEDFAYTLRGGKSTSMDENPYEIEDTLKIMGKGSCPKKASSLISDEKLPSTSRTRTSPEREMDEAPFQDVRFRPCINQSRYPVRDCFNLKVIGNALDEVPGSERTRRKGEIRNDPCRPEPLEDSEESNEDINRAIAESGLKLKRPQLILSDTSSGRSDSAEGTRQSESEFCAQDVAGRIQGEDISETSQSSRESPEERSGKSSDRDEASSESPVEVSISLKKLSQSGKNTERSGIYAVPSVSGKQLGYEACKNEKSSRHHLSESSDESDTVSPKKRQRKEHTVKNPVKRRPRNRRKSESDLRKRRPYDKDKMHKRKRYSGEQ